MLQILLSQDYAVYSMVSKESSTSNLGGVIRILDRLSGPWSIFLCIQKMPLGIGGGWVELKGWSLHPVPEATVPKRACVVLPRPGKDSYPFALGLAALPGSRRPSCWSLREGAERQKERATLVSGPPRGPQEPEAAPEVVSDPRLCS